MEVRQVAPWLVPAPIVPERPLVFRGARWRRLGESLIEALLFLAAFVSICTPAGIIAVLLFETIAFFRAVPVLSFLTGTVWTPLFVNPQFGVLPLVAATKVVGVVAKLA